jgi:hypothetical protein
LGPDVAHHKDDTMTTTGHIVNAMRDIDDEQGKNDWVSAVVDVPGRRRRGS